MILKLSPRTRQEKILEHLFKVAIAVPKIGGGKLAAAIVYKSDIVCIGVNQLKTHPLQSKHTTNPLRKSLHAEIAAIVRGSRILDDDEFSRSSLYVARAKKECGADAWGLAKPCTGCINCISAFNIQNVCYTNDDGSYSQIGMK